MVRSEVLRENPFALDRRAEAKGHSSRLSEDGEGTGSVADLESHFSVRHDPGAIGEGALLRSQGYGTVGKSRGKDERLLSLRLYLR